MNSAVPGNTWIPASDILQYCMALCLLPSPLASLSHRGITLLFFLLCHFVHFPFCVNSFTLTVSFYSSDSRNQQTMMCHQSQLPCICLAQLFLFFSLWNTKSSTFSVSRHLELQRAYRFTRSVATNSVLFQFSVIYLKAGSFLPLTHGKVVPGSEHGNTAIPKPFCFCVRYLQ